MGRKEKGGEKVQEEGTWWRFGVREEGEDVPLRWLDMSACCGRLKRGSLASFIYIMDEVLRLQGRRVNKL